ncbi:MAG TPA: hypothetical protein VMF65_13335 [Acidimicrobiales bacterium]|nr:hypothetical protein [Acidimicrobiales bacterium]
MATSVRTSDGMWATIPMGNLDQSRNTFWQLFFRPTGAVSWSDQVQATATATNGGLVLASGEGKSLIVGVRPSQGLTFSPLISTSDGARSWSDGLITEALAARPDALAADAGGQVLAVVDAAGGGQVLTADGGLSTWRRLATQRWLSTGVGRECGVNLITAVGFRAGQPLIGATCSRPGVVGLFSYRSGAWRLAGPALPSSLDLGSVEVLALEPGGARPSALLAVGQGHRARLVAAWSAAGGHWSTSPPLTLGPDEHLVSLGPAPGAGIFVLLSSASGRESLAVSRPSGAWQQLPSPPGGTETVAFGTGQPVTALAASATVLTVWSLRSSSGLWVKTQVTSVPIQYGSSS